MPAYITVNTIVEFFCFAISLLCLYKDKDPAWRGLILFMFTTCLVEVMGIYIRIDLHKPNFMLYNVFLIVECLFLSYFFYHLYKLYYSRIKLLVIWLSIFLISFITELLSNNFSRYVFVTSTIVSVVMILASVYYYFLVINEDQFRKLSVYAPFWWVSGTLCFYFASTASNVFFTYLAQDNSHIVGHSVRYLVFIILNIILYLNWSYSFICRYRQRISSTLSD